MIRTAITFNRLARIVKSGKYDKEEMFLDMSDFLEFGTLSQQEFNDLLVLIEQYPPTVRHRASMNEEGELVSDNTFILLIKQISVKAYDVDVIKQMTTNFKITNAISREQFAAAGELIEMTYNPPAPEEVLPEEPDTQIPEVE